MSEDIRQDIDPLGDWQRTHGCGELRAEHKDCEVLLMGWVNSRRDLGSLIFIDLRDRDGITQVVFDPQVDEESHERARVLRNEWVVAVGGVVSPRLEGQENFSLPTGRIEVKATSLKLLNRTETPPFQVDGAVDASETLRLKYRYLELRRPQVFNLFRRRHQIAAMIREGLNRRGFMEVETPFLTRSTPEGARDYLVPSRVNRSRFYALPQSPQLFKQLLMIAGFDRYYQIVRCFRDEDLRADRQPEFTQVDLEMAFVDENSVMGVFEELMTELFKAVLDMEIPSPIPRIEYHDAMARFGTDRPDTRFGMELTDVTDIAGQSEFRVFRSASESGGVVKLICVKGGAGAFSRKNLDELGSVAAAHGAKGLVSVKVGPDREWQSSVKKFFSDDIRAALNERVDAAPGDLLLMAADQPRVADPALGAVRLNVAERMGLIDEKRFDFVWVTRFPLVEFDEAEDRLVAVHHPFTAPVEADLSLMATEPERVRARAYDLVLNGAEIGGGSIRIHTLDLQEKVFQLLGIGPEEARDKFGFLLEALKYGAPPHGGMALGFDRLVAMMTGASSIREVIAFPKTTSATCLLTDAPSEVDPAQLEELGLGVLKE